MMAIAERYNFHAVAQNGLSAKKKSTIFYARELLGFETRDDVDVKAFNAKPIGNEWRGCPGSYYFWRR